jgi:serine/threonine protein kinase
MGAVYRCSSTLIDDIEAAVKVLLPHHVEASRDRFLREVRSVYNLRHPSVIHIRGFGEDPKLKMLWLAMELVKGAELGATIEAGPCEVPKAVALMYRLADGLAHCHENGVFHRDLKPANILIRPAGTPVILDFGIAGEEGRTRLTKTGTITGTPCYMAPEIFQGAEVSTALCDVYALGQILYELLLGVTAFPEQNHLSDGQQIVQVMGKKIHGGPLDPGDEYPDSLRALIRASTHPDPKKRLQSAESLVMNSAWVLNELGILLPEAAVRIDRVRRALENPSEEGWEPLGLSLDEASQPALGTMEFDIPSKELDIAPVVDFGGSGTTMAVEVSAPKDQDPVGTMDFEVPASKDPDIASTMELEIVPSTEQGLDLPRQTSDFSAMGSKGVVSVFLAGAGTLVVLLLLIVVVGGGAIGGMWFSSQGSSEPAPISTEAEEIARMKMELEEIHRSIEKSSSEEAAETPAPIEVEAKPAPKKAPVPVAQPVVAPRKPMPTVKPKPVPTAPIAFTSVPMGAEVFIDGKSIGNTPIGSAALPIGSHRVVMLKGDAHKERTITVGDKMPVRYIWRVATDKWESGY